MTAALALVPTRGCSRFTARCTNARDYNVEMADCCRSHVVQMMGDLAFLLNASDITWWADYGTLLGAVRNPMTTWADYPWLEQEGRDTAGPAPGIVPHDKDADLGVLFRDWRKYRELKFALTRKGYSVRLNGGRASSKVRLSEKNHTNVDLFFWRDREGTMFRTTYAQVDKCKGREFPREMVKNLSTVEWEGMTLPAPADPKAFLEMRYGPNWRVPIPANTDGIVR